jgi:hypothetical protein
MVPAPRLAGMHEAPRPGTRPATAIAMLLLALLVSACFGPAPSSPSPLVVPPAASSSAVPFTGTGVSGHATGGPTCPVERPGDPACAPRPVAGAVIVVRGADGAEVARATTDVTGLYQVALAPGDYTLEAGPVAGYMSAQAPTPLTVTQGAVTTLDVAYDTGIR